MYALGARRVNEPARVAGKTCAREHERVGATGWALYDFTTLRLCPPQAGARAQYEGGHRRRVVRAAWHGDASEPVVLVLDRVEPLHLRLERRVFRRPVGNLVMRPHVAQLRQQCLREVTEREPLR